MSLMQLGLLESIFHVTSFLMEIPTGVVADLFGRRMSRLIGRLLSVISLVLILLGEVLRPMLLPLSSRPFHIISNLVLVKPLFMIV